MTEDIIFQVAGHTISGKGNLRTQVYDHAAKLDITHLISSPRIDIEASDKKASLTATVMAQHFRPGEGLKPGALNFLQAGVPEVELVKDSEGSDWRIAVWKLKPTWSQGGTSILQPDS